MPRATVDRNLVARRREIVAYRFLWIQGFTVLIEIGDLEPGTGFDPARLRLQLTE